MSLGRVFVIVYSIILIVLFTTFTYLMTTVNPPKLKRYLTSTTPTEPTESLTEARSNLDELVPREVFLDHLPSLIERKYGIKPADIINDILAQMNRTTQLIKLVNRETTTGLADLQDIHFSLASRKKEQQKVNQTPEDPGNDTYFQRVAPPKWPILTSPVPSSETPSQVKGFRRSVTGINNDSEQEYNNDAVILKFVNEKGEPVIEIKLGANGALKRFTRKNRSPDVWVEETDESAMGKNLVPRVIKFAPDNYSVLFENNEEHSDPNDEEVPVYDNFTAVDLEVQKDDYLDYKPVEKITVNVSETRDVNLFKMLGNIGTVKCNDKINNTIV